MLVYRRRFVVEFFFGFYDLGFYRKLVRICWCGSSIFGGEAYRFYFLQYLDLFVEFCGSWRLDLVLKVVKLIVKFF